MPKYDKLLVLDIDESLIYASESQLDRKADFTFNNYHIYKRPNVENFIKTSLDLFKVCVWTTAGEDYANHILNEIFDDADKLEFIWTRNKCIRSFNHDTQEETYIVDIKKITKLGYSKDNIIFVDDSNEKMKRNYGNAVIVKKYLGDPEDSELNFLVLYLEKLGPVGSIRKVEKRNWKNKL